MMVLHINDQKNITLAPHKRVSVMITAKVNTKLKTLADYYELPKKYVIKMLVEDRIEQVNHNKSEVATR